MFHTCSLTMGGGCFFLRDQNLTDLMPLYKTMKKATFSDSEDEVCLPMYMFTPLFGGKIGCKDFTYIYIFLLLRMMRKKGTRTMMMMMKTQIHLEHPQETTG